MTYLLADLVERAATKHGDKPAFRYNGVDLTYPALLERSNRLANTLRSNGVQPGDLVGILMGKALENSVAIFGIMAAGAAYVPLDPAAPTSRTEQIVRSCNLSHIVTDQQRSRNVAELCRAIGEPLVVVGVANIDAPNAHTIDWAEVETYSQVRPDIAVSPDDLAYLIFTSGSTGIPKGIMHTHRSGMAYASMAAQLYDLRPDDRLSNFPPLHFDQSTFDFFSGPLAGATTVIIGKEHQLVPASLAQLIEDERLSIWYSVPLALVQLLLYGALNERDCSSIRWVVYGGEPFPLKHLKALINQWPQARFSNCYGPAETNQCTYHHIDSLDADAVERDAGIPIGIACPGMDTLIVDTYDAVVADGVEGELVVRSPTTMKGYWAAEDLNDQAFLDCDHHGSPQRYYRTGDIVRRNEAGLLEFIGRRDRQVKVRGFRVELDEIEAALLTHPAIKEVAVISIASQAVKSAGTDVDEHVNGKVEESTLAAYVSLGPEVACDERSLKHHASERLARYAVPTSITFVSDFPRTTSGKIDYIELAKQGVRS